MTQRDTYAEYYDLRIRCGFYAENAMSRSVWEGCCSRNQESMLNQFREPARKRELAELAQIEVEARALW